jgi:hypothetical protein
MGCSYCNQERDDFHCRCTGLSLFPCSEVIQGGTSDVADCAKRPSEYLAAPKDGEIAEWQAMLREAGNVLSNAKPFFRTNPGSNAI